METDIEARFQAAVARLDAGDLAGAAATCQSILNAQPDHAAALNLRGVLSAELLDHEAAVAAFSRSLGVRPNSSNAWHNLANSLDQLGRLDEARDAYANACRLDPGLVEAHFELAALGGAEPPTMAPRRYVERFFDSFAKRYDEHLAGLDDQVPQLVEQALRRLTPRRAHFPLVVDLGCGTGRLAPVLRPLATGLIGVDLASAMLAEAHDRGLYDELVQAEMIAYLEQSRATADLIVAADVFIYVGDLLPALSAVRAALKPDGFVIFTTETAAGSRGYELDRSRRFRHSTVYVENLAKQQGFACKSHSVQLRAEPSGPVLGTLFELQAE